MACNVVGGAVDGDFALYGIESALWFHPHAARISTGFGGDSFSLHPCGGSSEEAFLSEGEVLSPTNDRSALSVVFAHESSHVQGRRISVARGSPCWRPGFILRAELRIIARFGSEFVTPTAPQWPDSVAFQMPGRYQNTSACRPARQRTA